MKKLITPSTSVFLLVAMAITCGCTKKNEPGPAPESGAAVAPQALPVTSEAKPVEPGVLKKAAVGGVYLLDAGTPDQFRVKIVFPNEQIVGNAEPQGPETPDYTKRTYPVRVEAELALYDGVGFLGKIELPETIEGRFWCENDGGTEYRPEYEYEIEKSKLSRPLTTNDKSLGFAAFAVVGEGANPGALTYKVPADRKTIYGLGTKAGGSPAVNLRYTVWDDTGPVKYGPYGGLTAGDKSYALTCDGP